MERPAGLAEPRRGTVRVFALAGRPHGARSTGIEDNHNFTWGAIGYNHLDAAQKQGQAALDAALGHIAERINSRRRPARARWRSPCSIRTAGRGPTWSRPAASIPVADKAAGVVVKDRAGRVVPSQIVKADKDAQGNLIVADVAFPADRSPRRGYDTYYLDFTPQAAPPRRPACGSTSRS